MCTYQRLHHSNGGVGEIGCMGFWDVWGVFITNIGCYEEKGRHPYMVLYLPLKVK